jgi:hypothetical protein
MTEYNAEGLGAVSLLRGARWVLAGALVLAACSGTREPEPPGSGDAHGGILVSSSVPSAEFCDMLSRIVAAEVDAFSSLRAAPQGLDQWRGSLVPPGLADCSIVGARPAGSQYVCWGPSVPSRAELDRLEPVFQATVGKIDRCLGPQAGPGARLTRGPVISFAGGERVALWRDGVGSPAPGLSLRLEEELASGAYTISLSAVTLR